MQDALDIDRVVAWVQEHKFQRVAVQLPDELLSQACRYISQLQRRLPKRKLFLLGDSTYGSSSVDEVGAEHYGADCIVHVGSSDQEHAGALPVLFVFSQAAATDDAPTAAVTTALIPHFRKTPGVLLLICEVPWQWLLERLSSEIGYALIGVQDVLIAEPQQEALVSRRGVGTQRHDWRFGIASIAAWWSIVGTLAIAAVSEAEPVRVCGRIVARSVGGPPKQELPAEAAILYIGEADSGLERRLLLRHGYGHPIWRLSPSSSEVTKITSDALLMKRYRFVELARSAGVFGLLLCATGASYGSPLADRLQLLLRRAGRQAYRFIVGRVTPEKLGNFPDIECFVSLASPDHFPFDTKEFHVPIVSPYELEVALGVREWTGSYVTDLEELLAAPVPVHSLSEEEGVVQTLGAGARLRQFNVRDPGEPQTSQATKISVLPDAAAGPWMPPALATSGLHGVAGHYATEG